MGPDAHSKPNGTGNWSNCGVQVVPTVVDLKGQGGETAELAYDQYNITCKLLGVSGQCIAGCCTHFLLLFASMMISATDPVALLCCGSAS